MIIDLDNLLWIDSDNGSYLVLGFSVVAEISSTSQMTNINKNSEDIDTNIKYTAVFNGLGNTFDEMSKAFDSDFNEIPIPKLFPIIGQDNSISRLKKLCIKFIKLQYGAIPSRLDITRDLEKKDKIMSILIDKYINIFKINNDLN